MSDQQTEELFEKYFNTKIKITPVDFYNNLFLIKNDFHINANRTFTRTSNLDCSFSVTTFEEKFDFESNQFRFLSHIFKITNAFFNNLDNRNENFSFDRVELNHIFFDKNFFTSLVFKLVISYSDNGKKYEKEFWFQDIKTNDDFKRKITYALGKI